MSLFRRHRENSSVTLANMPATATNAGHLSAGLAATPISDRYRPFGDMYAVVHNEVKVRHTLTTLDLGVQAGPANTAMIS